MLKPATHSSVREHLHGWSSLTRPSKSLPDSRTGVRLSREPRGLLGRSVWPSLITTLALSGEENDGQHPPAPKHSSVNRDQVETQYMSQLHTCMAESQLAGGLASQYASLFFLLSFYFFLLVQSQSITQVCCKRITKKCIHGISRLDSKVCQLTS